MSRIFAAVVGCIFVFALGEARADSWNETFESAGALVAGEGSSVLVVHAGERSEAGVRATQALMESVRRQAELVMDTSALGDVSGLADQEIVTRSAHLPVTRVAILRHFPGEGEGTAVVTVYDKEATVLASFSAVPGKPVAQAGQGVSPGAVGAVGSLSAQERLSAEEALERYERTYLWFEDWVAVTRTGAVVASWSNPLQGKHKKRISPAEFFEAVDRPDLAATYRSRQAWKTGLSLGGSVLTLGGLAYLLVEILGDMDGGFDSTPLIIGGSVMTGGIVLGLVAGSMNPYPITNVEAKELADEHNKKLRRQLGLDREAKGKVRPGIAALPGGGGLTLSGSF